MTAPGMVPRGQRVSVETGLPYGDHQAMEATQKSAPMAKTDMQSNPAPAPTGGPPPDDTANLEPFGAPGDGRPITSGVDIGEGPGSEVLQRAPQRTTVSDDLLALAASDTSGVAAMLGIIAGRMGI